MRKISERLSRSTEPYSHLRGLKGFDHGCLWDVWPTRDVNQSPTTVYNGCLSLSQLVDGMQSVPVIGKHPLEYFL